ncbi:RES family NAD+ phosphorylase [Lysobacter silvisoli]|uniref:RES domain-containing protein n=1 Tax=Lysobacter silvisoli TaxID=2293254 RepID=A0A371K3Z1_9GAMM|nr:RES family NAD+ phosphorylase [Lysobacter silvisoli]RDZ28567.1 RES domain-containing protein [Lysobacter silvisoli]
MNASSTSQQRPALAKRDKQLADSFPASDPPSTTDPRAPQPQPAHPHLSLYRVVAAEDADRAYSEDAVANDARWTSPGRRVVYASLSPASAVLEFLVHARGEIPRELRLAVASVPADCCHTADRVPEDWDQRPYREHVRRVGDCWLDSGCSLGLLVPSALSPREKNVLLSLSHQDCARLQLLSQDLLRLDTRLTS